MSESAERKTFLDPSVSVRQILTARIFSGYRLYAGSEGIDNQVKHITVFDVPDAIAWLEGGELVCTTGYIFSQNSELQVEWLETAAKGGAAGVVIKPERFLGEIPERMIETANRLRLPLIGINIEVLWSDVIQETMDMLLAQQLQRLQEIYEIHNQLDKEVLASRGIQKLLEKISQIVGCFITFEDNYFNLIESSTGEIPAEEDAARAARRKAVQGKLKEIRKFQFIPEDIKGDINQIFVPVIAGENDFGWLIAHSVAAGRQDFVRAALEHGATAVALEQLGRFAGMQSKTEQINSFIREMLKDQGITGTEIVRYGQMLGVDLSQPCLVIQIYCTPCLSNNALYKCIDIVKAEDKNGLVSLAGQTAFVLYHPTCTEEPDLIDECRRLCYKVVNNCSRDGYTCHIGIGGICSIFDCAQFRRSYRQAELCVKHAMMKRDTILFYSDMGVSRIFPFLENHEAFEHMAEDLFKPLVRYDESLVTTFQSYVSQGFNKVQAAKDLNVHVNTINYRLAKIQELLRIDFDDADTCIFYYIAATAYMYHLKEENEERKRKDKNEIGR